MAWAVTSSKAKKVKWSQRQMVLSSPSSVEQPWESQSPVSHTKVRAEKTGGDKGREGPLYPHLQSHGSLRLALFLF